MNSKATSIPRRTRHGQRADLYLALAEALDEPPPWLTLPGQQWPLYTCAQNLAPISAAAARAVAAIAQVRHESMQERRARYRSVFRTKGRPRVWLHESLYRNGRLLGPQMFQVEQLYRVTGLQIAGNGLPDHASVELAFLAHLARQADSDPERGGQWQQMEKRFLNKHAGRWLPELGQGLAVSGDLVYAPIGRLLVGWMEELQRPVRKRRALRLPHVREADCTLCGFCVQVCPTKALAIDEGTSETTLLLAADRCSGCGRCVRTCETSAMELRTTRAAKAKAAEGEWKPLRRSPRATCPACGRPTVSRAELDFVASQLGRPRWLEYCLSCRAQLMEKNRQLPTAKSERSSAAAGLQVYSSDVAADSRATL